MECGVVVVWFYAIGSDGPLFCLCITIICCAGKNVSLLFLWCSCKNSIYHYLYGLLIIREQQLCIICLILLEKKTNQEFAFEMFYLGITAVLDCGLPRLPSLFAYTIQQPLPYLRDTASDNHFLTKAFEKWTCSILDEKIVPLPYEIFFAETETTSKVTELREEIS